jgi:hypothetical protein
LDKLFPCGLGGVEPALPEGVFAGIVFASAGWLSAGCFGDNCALFTGVSSARPAPSVSSHTCAGHFCGSLCIECFFVIAPPCLLQVGRGRRGEFEISNRLSRRRAIFCRKSCDPEGADELFRGAATILRSR